MTQPDLARLAGLVEQVAAPQSRDQTIFAWAEARTHARIEIANMVPSLLARIAALESIEVRAAQLVAKLDVVAPHINDAFTHRFLRCGNYTGPNYAAELDSLRAALTLKENDDGR